MLETWEDIIAPILIPFTEDQQNEDDIDSTAYSEPTIKELKEMMNARPLEEGYSVRMAAMVLPLSLKQYYDAFLADDAPSGLDQYLSAVSNTVLKNGTWKKATTLAPEEQRTAYGYPVSNIKTIGFTTQTGNPFAPVSNSDATFLEYLHTDTEIGMASIVWGADQFIVSDFKYFEKREILSPDPRSNQVVVRCQYKVVWLSHPFGVWKIIDNAVANRIKDSEKILKTWFPAKAKDFLKTVPKQLMVSQTTPEVRLALEP